MRKAYLLLVIFGLSCFSAYSNNYGYPTITGELSNNLSSFSGKVVGCDIKLNWGTNHEIGNDYFEIERSIDGERFFSIGKVAGSGNSINPVSYQYSDENIFKSDYYYRLKLVDFNGEHAYSNVIRIETSCKRKGVSIDKIYPGDSQWINIKVFTDRDLENARLVIADENEIPVKQVNTEIKPGMNLVLFDSNGLSKGTYLIKIKDDQMEVSSIKFIKTN